MKRFSKRQNGVEVWYLTTNRGTLLGTFLSEQAARAREMALTGFLSCKQPTSKKGV